MDIRFRIAAAPRLFAAAVVPAFGLCMAAAPDAGPAPVASPFSIAWIAAVAGVTLLVLLVARVFGGHRRRGAASAVLPADTTHVICHLSPETFEVAHQLRRLHRAVTILEPDPHHPHAALCRRSGMRVLALDPRDPVALARAGVAGAHSIFVGPGGGDGECWRPVTLDVVLAVEQACRGTTQHAAAGARPRCVVFLEPPTPRRAAVDPAQWWQGPRSAPSSPRVDLLAFDPCEAASRLLLRADLSHLLRLVAHGYDIHILMFGFGPLAHALLLHCACVCHFSNRRPTRITVVDPDASRHRAQFLERHPCFAREDAQRLNLARVQFVERSPAEPDVTSGRILDRLIPENESGLLAVCDEDDLHACTLARQLSAAAARRGFSVFTQIRHRPALARLLAHDAHAHPQRAIGTFAAPADTCSLGAIFGGTHDVLARAVIHQMQKERLGADEPEPGRGLPAFDSPEHARMWARLPASEKTALRRVADHLEVLLATIGTPVADLRAGRLRAAPSVPEHRHELLAEMEHNRWCSSRLIADWDAGATEDAEARTHPWIVPWDDLPEEGKERARDKVRQIPAIFAPLVAGAHTRTRTSQQ